MASCGLQLVQKGCKSVQLWTLVATSQPMPSMSPCVTVQVKTTKDEALSQLGASLLMPTYHDELILLQWLQRLSAASVDMTVVLLR